MFHGRLKNACGRDVGATACACPHTPPQPVSREAPSLPLRCESPHTKFHNAPNICVTTLVSKRSMPQVCTTT
eukprot:16448020-Heterocapsa_arctica.AAC.1